MDEWEGPRPLGLGALRGPQTGWGGGEETLRKQEEPTQESREADDSSQHDVSTKKEEVLEAMRNAASEFRRKREHPNPSPGGASWAL